MPTVQVTVRRQQGGQEQQMLFRTPVNSSFVDHKLEQLYGPGLLCLEGSNAVLAATEELQPAKAYVYQVSAGAPAAAGRLTARQYVSQALPMMPERTSDRDSCSRTHANRAKTFEDLDAWTDFDADVLTFLETLDDTEAKFNPLHFRASNTDGNQAVLRSGPADESYVRSVLTHVLEGVSDVAEDIGLDTEYKDGGSGRSVSFTDMLLRVRGTSSKEDPSRLLVGVLEVKGQWQFKLPDGMTLQQGLEDDMQSASVIQVVQQAYGDAVQDECPLLLVSNYRSTFLLLRHNDVTNKRLKVAQWTWDDAGVPPLAAFLYVLKLASDLWHQGVKQHLSRERVPVTPIEGYRLDLSGRAINLNAAWFKGHAQMAPREQPQRSAKRSRHGSSAVGSQAADETHSSPTHSSPSSSSDTEAFSWFDAAAWAPSCMGVSSAAAVEALPVLPPSHVTCGPECLGSAPSRRIFKGCVGGQPAVLKVFSAEDSDAVAAFLQEARTYVKLAGVQGKCIPELLALGRLPHTGAPMIALSEQQPMQLKQLPEVLRAAEAALQGLHAQGFAHGDVHVGNLLRSGSRVLLCDLECARSASAGDPACEKDMAQLARLQEDAGAAPS